MGIKMTLKLDKGSDALYFRLDEAAIFESEEVQAEVIMDFNPEGRVVGIEILCISTRVSAEQLQVLQFGTR
tara:strand:+ start:82 stop:294 length:213 start_codon:yes stop_codon:yes gene_type:complete